MTISVPDGLRTMLEARNVAIVGASPREGTPGYQMLRQLEGGGFSGQIFPVNPNYAEIMSRQCFSSLNEIAEPVDLVILGVANRRLEELLQNVARKGIPAAVIFASGFEGDPSDTSLIERLREIAVEADITICGGNCMGFVNVEGNLRALAFEERSDLEPGPIAWISHSGSAFTALLHNDRRLRFNVAVSAGQELTTTIADYMAYAVEQPSTRAIAIFLETVRDPEGFRDALSAAAERDIPVVALKVGRAETARRLVTAHSGALAGEDAVYDAVFAAHGVMRVASLNEMADTLELVSSGRRARAGGVASIHDSGGERAHLIDVAADVGLPFAQLSPRTVARLEATLEPGLPPVNPLDAWGTGNEFEKIYLECMRALIEDDDTGAFAFVVDLAGEDLERGYTTVAEQVFSETDLPFAVVSNLSSAIDPPAAEHLRASGVPVLEDTFYGLAAFRKLFEYRDFHELRPVEVDPIDDGVHARWDARFADDRPWTEGEALHLLGDYGLPVAATVEVHSLDDAMDAGEAIGYPVALKITGTAHKSALGGLHLGIVDEDQMLRAFKTMSARFGPHLLVQKMAPPGVEMALGLINDAQFGSAVLVAAGGVDIEALRDRRLGMPPLDQTRARRMIDALRARPLLDAGRGRPAADIDALAASLVGLARLAEDLGPRIAALDVNPVVVGDSGCLAVDALVVPVSPATA
jgi:acetate---CoA ligase (ADP-forming)